MHGLARLAAGALLAGLVAAPGAGARNSDYPFLQAYGFTGTPLKFEIYDGGPAGQVAVICEHNLKSIVPNSYAAVVTSSYDIVVRSVNGALQQVSSLPRPGASQPSPDLNNLKQLCLAPHNYTPQAAGSLVDIPGVTTKFEMFHSSLGFNQIVTFPENLSVDTNGFQAGNLKFTFLIGNQRQDYTQPALTPSLDEAKASITSALKDEDQALKDFAPFERHGGAGFQQALKRAKIALVAARLALAHARRDFKRGLAAGELSSLAAFASAGLALEGDTEAEHEASLQTSHKYGRAKIALVEAHLKAAEKDKRTTLTEIAKQKAARATGT